MNGISTEKDAGNGGFTANMVIPGCACQKRNGSYNWQGVAPRVFNWFKLFENDGGGADRELI